MTSPVDDKPPTSRDPTGPRARWHLVYYWLAALNVIALASGLLHSARTLGLYEDSIAASRIWTERSVAFLALEDAAESGSAAGNAVFDRAVLAEQEANASGAQAKFEHQLAVCRNLLVDVEESQLTFFDRAFDEIVSAHREQVKNTLEIFAHFRASDRQSAGESMSRMDHAFYQLRKSIDEVITRVGKEQSALLERQRQTTRAIRRFEIGFALAILLIAAAVTVHGLRLAERARNSLAESERMSSALAASEAQTRAIVENAADAILTLDHAGRVVSANAAAERMVGASARSMIGREASHYLIGLDKIETAGACVARANGSPTPIEVARGWFMFDGTRRSVLVARDISERTRTLELLERARGEAERATRSKSSFLANVSHEIRTPMNGILGMTELLLDSHLTAEQRDCARTVKDCSEALLAILNDVLDFSKFEAGKLELEAIDFDLRELVAAVLDMFVTRAEEKHIELLNDVDSEVPTHVVGDPARLRQVLTNLVSNAVKFTNDGGEIELRVRVRELLDGRCDLEFSCRDDGIGIPADRIGRLFQPFAQASASTSRTYGGTGLGLAICQQIVQCMGGRIKVDSKPGQGSRFSFRAVLPRARSQFDAARVQELARLRGARVLIVDNNPSSRRLLERKLTSIGCRAEAVASGREALARITENTLDPYAIVLLDSRLSQAEGITVGREILAVNEARPPALVFLSSRSALGEAAAARDLGFTGSLSKPVRDSLLCSVLAEAIGHRDGSGAPDPSNPVPPDLGAPPRPICSRRILLAEDNLVNQKIAARILERAGHRVTIANDGQEAVNLVETQDFDLVLMDCQMPVVDGISATRMIRSRNDHKGNVPIIALTANALAQDRQLAFDARMNDYLVKPLRSGDLLAAIERWTTNPIEPAPQSD